MKQPLLSLLGTTNYEAQRSSFLMKWYDDWGPCECLRKVVDGQNESYRLRKVVDGQNESYRSRKVVDGQNEGQQGCRWSK